MKRLYRAETNAMSYYVVEDWDTDLAIIIDWDLSESEEEQLIKDFDNGEINYNAVGGEWMPISEAYTELFGKTLLS